MTTPDSGTDPAAAPAQQQPPGAAAPVTPYVAVIVFHGMGQQRHHESLAELVESIDGFVYRQSRIDPAAFPAPRLARKTRREKVRVDAGMPEKGADDAIYVQTDYGGSRVRFYEGYWAPATADGTTARSAFFWLIAQLPRPLKVLAAPWRAFGRLRRGDLLGMAFAQPGADSARAPPVYSTLVRLYGSFVRRRPPESGDYCTFVQFVRKSINDDKQCSEAIRIVREWRLRHVIRQCTDALGLLGVGLAITAGAILLLLGALAALHSTSEWLVSFDPGSWPYQVSEQLKPDFKTAWAFAALLLGAFGVAGFLRDAVGDVQQFVTYEEAEPLHARREKILALAESTLRQVLKDPACERVVIVAHSLGTAVALDTILRLRASNQAENPAADAQVHMDGPLTLGKIQHLVTCGSPIDKINYFFATLRSKYRSFEIMVDDLRGDIGDIPFSRSGKQPYLHWVNYWDRGDPVSDPLYTVASADELRIQRVDNTRVVNYLWPDPGASHTAYFEHRDVVAFVYNAAFRNHASFATPPRAPDPGGKGERPVYLWQGPGTSSRVQTALFMLLPATALLLIWTTVGLVLPQVPAPSLACLGLAVGLLVAGAIAQRVFKLHRAPIGR